MTRELPVHVQARRDDFLASVHRRAGQLRRRRAAVVMAPVIAIAGAVAFATVATQGGPGKDNTRVEVLGETATSTTAPPTTTPPVTTAAPTTTTKPRERKPPPKANPTTTFVLPPLPTATTTTPRPTVPPATAAPTTAPPVCQNSYDPRCGAFRWSPAPGSNRSLAVSLAVSDTAPAAGTRVSFTVDLSDGDATPQCASASIAGRAVKLTDSAGRPVRACVVVVCAQGPVRYGPWTPPAPSGGFLRAFGTFVATGQGAQNLAVVASSGGGCPYEPYGSTGSKNATITVS